MVLLVRAGSAQDPPGKGGLAHLLEHAVFEGSFDLPGAAFIRSARRSGVEFNAHTAREFTTFEFSAPASSFFEEAGQMLKLVTSPGLDRVNVERVAAVVKTENAWRGTPRVSLLDSALFDTQDNVLGTGQSRDRIKADDLVDFYARWYVPSNITMVVAGPVEVDRVGEWVLKALRLPPSLPEEWVERRAERMTLPVDQRTRAPLGLTIVGYAVEAEDAAMCESLADVLDRRLAVTRELSDIGASAEVGCTTLRGNLLLLAEVSAAHVDASTDLSALVERTFATVQRSPPTAKEMSALVKRHTLLQDRKAAHPSSLAMELAVLAAQQRSGRSTDLRSLRPPASMRPPDIRAFAKRNFQPERRVSIVFTPYEG